MSLSLGTLPGPGRNRAPSEAYNHGMKHVWLGWSLLALAIVGCGGKGGEGAGVGQVAGNVTDVNGNPVRGALVTAGDAQGFTNPSGVYILDGVRTGDVPVRAEVTQDGVSFSGETVALVFENERTKSVNIPVVRTSQQATIRGVVTNRSGNRMKGVKIFAINAGLASVVAISDSEGEYRLPRLQAGLDYYAQASAPGFVSDDISFNLATGETRTLNFVLSEAGDPRLPAPTMRGAVAWTTPTTRSTDGAVFESVKNLLKPERTQLRRGGASREIPGTFIEIDLYWNFVDSLNLLGYGVYRANASFGPFEAVDFLRDPLAEFYADFSDELRIGNPYYYRLTSINSQYPDGVNGESSPSSVVSARVLGELTLRTPLDPLTFRWNRAAHATQYQVLVFSSYPAIGVTPFWASARTNNDSLAYTGPSLEFGKIYYYLVVGYANDDTGITLSDLSDFFYGG